VPAESKSCAAKMSDAFTNTLTRRIAIERGFKFLERFGAAPNNFKSYGSLLTCCFALAAVTSRDPQLRNYAGLRARRLATRWLQTHRAESKNFDRDLLLEFVFVGYALKRLGEHRPKLIAQLTEAARRFSPNELLGFDPADEPPPSDLPYSCNCGLRNQRGRKFCKGCRRKLTIQSRYRVWMEALANTYVAERCGITLGASYADVFKWLPAMRPYPTVADPLNSEDELWSDAIYAVTHVVYTLNDYGAYKISSRGLSPEFELLKDGIANACLQNDVELLGELLDSLQALGLPRRHPLIRRGTKVLLASINNDGSWGDPDEENVRRRCHTTWTALDGLRTLKWRTRTLNRHPLRTLLRSST
jgi:uncharacterized protein DUF6895